MTEYKATKWDSADDKRKFERQFKKFVESGFDRKKFPKWFYQRLSLCFGHIAHYDIDGFYSEFFTTKSGQVRFLNMTMQHQPAGDPEYTYSDVETVLQQWIRDEQIVEKYKSAILSDTARYERAELARLKAKYE